MSYKKENHFLWAFDYITFVVRKKKFRRRTPLKAKRMIEILQFILFELLNFMESRLF